MTANELADLIENEDTLWLEPHLNAIAIMLRQQAQKIENLLDQYQRLNENLEMWKTGHFKQQAEIETLKKENEDRESAIYATGYWNGISKKNERA